MADTTTPLSTARSDALGMIGAILPLVSADRVTTAAGDADGKKLYINKLNEHADDSFIDSWYAILPEGPTAAGGGSLEAKRIADFDQFDSADKTEITIHGAFSAQVESAADAYVSPVHPETLRLALNESATTCFPDVLVPRRYKHIRGSRVFNGLFDHWTSTLPAWWARSHATELAVTKSYDPYIGDIAVKLVNSGSVERYLYTLAPGVGWLNELDGYSVTLHAMMSMGTAGDGTLDIVDGAGSDTDETAAVGDNTWDEVITASRSMVLGLATGTRIEFRVTVAAGATVYVGAVWSEGGPAQRYVPIPLAFHRGISRMEEASTEFPSVEQDYEELDDWTITDRYPASDSAGTLEVGRTIRIPGGYAASPRVIVFEGDDYLSQATAETDVYEVADPQKRLFYARALAALRREVSQQPGAADPGVSRLLENDWMKYYEGLKKQEGMVAPRGPVSLRPMFSGPGYGVRRGLDEGENE